MAVWVNPLRFGSDLCLAGKSGSRNLPAARASQNEMHLTGIRTEVTVSFEK